MRFMELVKISSALIYVQEFTLNFTVFVNLEVLKAVLLEFEQVFLRNVSPL